MQHAIGPRAATSAIIRCSIAAIFAASRHSRPSGVVWFGSHANAPYSSAEYFGYVGCAVPSRPLQTCAAVHTWSPATYAAHVSSGTPRFAA